jgi:hypothetical protein
MRKHNQQYYLTGPTYIIPEHVHFVEIYGNMPAGSKFWEACRMPKGFCTTLKVMGVISGVVIEIYAIYLLVTMLSAASYAGYYSSEMGGVIFNSVIGCVILMLAGFSMFATLFSMGALGDYMRKKLQRDGLWVLPPGYAPAYYG